MFCWAWSNSLPLLFNHGCWSASFAVILEFLSSCSIYMTRSFASADTIFQCFWEILNLHYLLFIRMVLRSVPSNSYLPVRIVYKITPALNMSHCWLYPSCLSTSGATYPGDPHWSWNNWSLPCICSVRPKSVIWSTESSSCLAKMRFSGFKSRCMINWVWRWSRPERKSRMIGIASDSLYKLFVLMRLNRSSPCRWLRIRWMYFLVSKTSCSLMTFGWSTMRRIRISSSNDYYRNWLPVKRNLPCSHHSLVWSSCL